MTEGFFDKDFRLEEERRGDPLSKLNELIPWEDFRPKLERMRKSEEERKSPAGRNPFDVVLMFKIMILQSLYDRSDGAVEFQVKNWLSFMRFLNLSLADRVPDEKTIWSFRERLGQLGLESKLFAQFYGYAPKQRNSRDESNEIRKGFERTAGARRNAARRTSTQTLSRRKLLPDRMRIPVQQALNPTNAIEIIATDLRCLQAVPE